MEELQFPQELLSGLKDSIDMNVYFFDNRVSQPVMYTLLGGSIVICIGGYILLHTLKKKTK